MFIALILPIHGYYQMVLRGLQRHAGHAAAAGREPGRREERTRTHPAQGMVHYIYIYDVYVLDTALSTLLGANSA